MGRPTAEELDKLRQYLAQAIVNLDEPIGHQQFLEIIDSFRNKAQANEFIAKLESEARIYPEARKQLKKAIKVAKARISLKWGDVAA